MGAVHRHDAGATRLCHRLSAGAVAHDLGSRAEVVLEV
jgi:hypothetical protein